MPKTKRKPKEDFPAPQNAYYIQDCASVSDKVYVENVLLSLKEHLDCVKDYGENHDCVIDGMVRGLSRNGRARLVYRNSGDKREICSLAIWDNPSNADEFAEVEYYGLSFAEGSKGYDLLAEIEEIYREKLKEEAKAKIARRAARTAGILKAAGVIQ